jgi:competence protein ComEC
MTSIPWPPGGAGIAVATLCTVLAAWALLTKRGVVAAVAGVLVIGALSTTVGAHTVSWTSAPRDWSVAQCDVGQGDALVMRDGAETVLIDTGRDETALRACLTRLGVGRISLLVLTHFDIDHVGAYRVVVGKVDRVVHGPTDGFADELTLSEFHQSGATVTQVERGARGTSGRWSWAVLWPTRTIETEPGNPSSVVTSFTSTSSLPSVVDLGDLPAREQEMMFGLGGISPVDVVKVSHHGSKDQFPGLYERLRAGVALVGVGNDNEYGHPTDFALAMLVSTGSAVIRSDVNGIGLVERNARGTLRVWTERAG